MKYSYRVTKYNSHDNKGNLCSNTNEWTSFYDIGTKVSLEDYLIIENEYLNFLIQVCDFSGEKSLKISDLEVNIDDFEFSDHQVITRSQILKVAQSNLREDVWCKLLSEKIEIHFGYDFYMYVICNIKPEEIIKKISTPLNIETFISPYS